MTPASGVDQKSIEELFRASLVPIIAICAGLVLVILYWFNVIQKEGFIKWIVGLIIAGSVAEIVALFVIKEGLINSPQMRDTTASCRGFIHATDVR